jgi:hypothetical protein
MKLAPEDSVSRPLRCLETSGTKYPGMLLHIPVEYNPQLNRCGGGGGGRTPGTHPQRVEARDVCHSQGLNILKPSGNITYDQV